MARRVGLLPLFVVIVRWLGAFHVDDITGCMGYVIASSAPGLLFRCFRCGQVGLTDFYSLASVFLP